MVAQRLTISATVVLGIAFSTVLSAADSEPQAAAPKLTVESGHPWTPPFGLGRVGRPLEAVVEFPKEAKVPDECVFVEYRDGQELARTSVKTRGRFARVALDRWPTEVAAWSVSDPQTAPVEVARAKVTPPAFEAEAVAAPERIVNPVDLGTVLVPADWLLLAGGQKADISVAALKRDGEDDRATAVAWYASAADRRVRASLSLRQGCAANARLSLGPASTTLSDDTLYVAVCDGTGREVWRKDVHVMLVSSPPSWPAFGAVATKLRYDLPVAAADGKTIPYDQAWDANLHDVVVTLPNGSRFVFWRGASYAPFWAGQYNTGLTYEWAEREPEPWGEPIMDQELRYGRVEIIESTEARVHVRWRYQPCNETYVVAGDSVVEDYYFYPDGFGVRTLTLTCDQDARYELNEFIVFRPPMAYPFQVLPANLVDMLWIDGGKEEFQFPCEGPRWDEFHTIARKKGQPPIFRVRMHRSEPRTPIQFSPWSIGPTDPYTPWWDNHGNLASESPERGTMAFPVWSCHWWPLSRGGGTLENSPGTSCIATAGYAAGPNALASRPQPVHSELLWTRDTAGHWKPMRRETHAWLIGMTDADDDRLREWAESFAKPPKLEVRGAKLAESFYAPTRRALGLIVDDGSESVEIAMTPTGHCVHPVFELQAAPPRLLAVTLDGKMLDRTQYAWDGRTFWLDAAPTEPSTLRLTFAGR